MKRVLGAVLIGLGVFSCVLAVLLPTVVVHGSKKIPLNLNITLHSIDPAAKVLDATTGQDKTVTLRATRFVQTDSTASNRSVTTQNETVCTVIVQGTTPDCFPGQRPQDANRDPRLLATTTDRLTVDRRTALAVPPKPGWGPETINGSPSMNNVPVKHVGVGYTFPIDTKKTTYKFFQPDLNAAYDATYVGTTRIKGLTVYEFVSKTGDQPYKINGTFDGTYNDTRTVWVEPRTGVIVNGTEHQTQTLQGGLVALDTTLAFDNAAQTYQANYAKDKLRTLSLAQTWGPIVFGVAGVAALVGGVLLLRSRRRQQAVVTGGPGSTGQEATEMVPTQSGDRHRASWRTGARQTARSSGSRR